MKALTTTILFNVILTIAAFFAVDSYGQSVGLGKALTHRQVFMIERQGIISSNIANATTPGYVAKDLDYIAPKSMGSLKPVRTSGKHLALSGRSARGKLISDKRHMRHDGNSVKLDEQMLKLSDVQMNYRFISGLKSKHKSMHKMALSANSR